MVVGRFAAVAPQPVFWGLGSELVVWVVFISGVAQDAVAVVGVHALLELPGKSPGGVLREPQLQEPGIREREIDRLLIRLVASARELADDVPQPHSGRRRVVNGQQQKCRLVQQLVAAQDDPLHIVQRHRDGVRHGKPRVRAYSLANHFWAAAALMCPDKPRRMYELLLMFSTLRSS